MKTITELANFIRFQLSQLGAQDKHHEFEHLARQFARLRVCENILPATGPVSAGGDQGRDFESYQTYLESTPIASSTFLGFAQNKKLVFACSLQQTIEGKIRSDISTICSAPQVVDEIFYFCEANLPVGRRHKLQKWCLETYGVSLEIFDGQALAEQLTNIDVFWLAEEYLDVPSEFYPHYGETEESYDKYKLRWLTQDDEPQSYADFIQVKYCLRRATFRNEKKPDLGKWLEKMESFISEGKSNELRQRATYEICVASLRGLNNLTERRGLVERYFSEIDSLTLTDISHIADSTTLLSYCSSAYLYRHFEIEVDKLYRWTKLLIEKIEDLLDSDLGSGSKCRLLQIRGQAGYLQFRKGVKPEVSLGEAFEWWERLLEEVNNSPLFPLDDFADLLTKMVEFVGEDERYLELTRKTDELLSKRSSGFIAAEKCRDRAVAYYKSAKYLLSIKQLHQSKIKWFSAETLRGSLMSMLLLSDCYKRLGLVYPAKYYASCVAYLAHHHDDENIKNLIPRALFVFAECCYYGGEWLTFSQIARWALAAHNMYEENPLDLEEHDELQRLYVHTAILRTITRRFDENLFRLFEDVYSQWFIDSNTRHAIDDLSTGEAGDWNNIEVEELWDRVKTQISGRPFSDAGKRRDIRWKANGIDWRVEFANEWLVSAITEELVSTLQIILADIANNDLLLLPTKVTIKARITDENEIVVEEIPSNTEATWRVEFPKYWIGNPDTMDDLRMAVLTLAVTILSTCSLLSYEDFHRKIEKAFSEGLPMKTFTVRPYSELYQDFLPEAEFDSANRLKINPLFPDLTFEAQENEQLAWISAKGPGYSKQRASEFLTNRYSQALLPIRFTLPRLLEYREFLQQISNLRKEGYLDWEILYSSKYSRELPCQSVNIT